jgi:hypothetical protein
MPRSKKGRLAGGARKEINGTRASETLSVALMTEAERARKSAVVDFVFGRITKMTGGNHVRASINTKRGPREISARIPNIFGRKGATPITTRSVVCLYTGEGFDPNTRSDDTAAEHFDIVCIFTERQVSDLKAGGAIPEWMAALDADDSKAGKADDVGFEWDYGAEDDDKKPAARGGSGAAAMGSDGEDSDGEVDIDAI